MARHDDVAAKVLFLGIKARDGIAFLGSQKLRKNGAAKAVKLACKGFPIIGIDATIDRSFWRSGGNGRSLAIHGMSSV